MRFSVIVPFRNAEATLGETLDSIQTQEHRGFEVVLVDDASTDRSVQVAAAHSLPHRLIRLTQHSGPGVARNRAAAEARGDFLAFLDADDLWFPWSLACLADAIDRHPDCSFVSGRELRGKSPPADTSPAPPRHRVFPDYFASSPEPLWIGVGGVAIRRAAFARSEGFGDWIGPAEDSHLWMQLGCEPGFIRVDSPPLFFYRASTGSLRNESEPQGYTRMVAAEDNDTYPGGKPRRRDRRQLLTRHTRSASLGLLASGMWDSAKQLYWSTFLANLAGLRLRYLLGFWLEALKRGSR